MVELETVVSRENSARSSRPHSRVVSHRASRNLSPGASSAASRTSSLSRSARSRPISMVSVTSLEVPPERNVRMTRRRSQAASMLQQPAEPVVDDDDDDEEHTPSRGGRVHIGSSMWGWEVGGCNPTG